MEHRAEKLNFLLDKLSINKELLTEEKTNKIIKLVINRVKLLDKNNEERYTTPEGYVSLYENNEDCIYSFIKSIVYDEICNYKVYDDIIIKIIKIMKKS